MRSNGRAFQRPTIFLDFPQAAPALGWRNLGRRLRWLCGGDTDCCDSRATGIAESWAFFTSKVLNNPARSMTPLAVDLNVFPRFCATEATSTRIPRRLNLVAR